jgi:hypothetical protein
MGTKSIGWRTGVQQEARDSEIRGPTTTHHHHHHKYTLLAGVSKFERRFRKAVIVLKQVEVPSEGGQRGVQTQQSYGSIML